ncbi:hypothetical protein ACIO6U_12630 [Streptomyces sp. NPDC087422]|uniref:hypothetical protein n=1 Tax=Streptomyces sp. NPDC087422 TaxID=3365786 RepID=UPI003805AE7E
MSLDPKHHQYANPVPSFEARPLPARRPETSVSAWAGHSDLSFTKRTYVHPDPQSLRAGSEKPAELLR